MAASQITVANAKLWYGTATEITTNASGTKGDVGWASDTNTEYTCTADGANWSITRLHNTAGAAVVEPDKGPRGFSNDGYTVAYTATAGTTQVTDTCTTIDITCTTDAFVVIAPSSTPALVAGGYFCSAGVTYRFPIVTNDYISAIRLNDSGNMYAHPVA